MIDELIESKNIFLRNTGISLLPFGILPLDQRRLEAIFPKILICADNTEAIAWGRFLRRINLKKEVFSLSKLKQQIELILEKGTKTPFPIRDSALYKYNEVILLEEDESAIKEDELRLPFNTNEGW